MSATKPTKYTDAQKAAYWKKQAKKPQAKPVKAVARRAPSRTVHGPPRRGLKGHGDYSQDIASAMGPLLSHGLPLVIKGLTGFGDYSVSSNSLIPKLGGDPPIIRNTKSGGFISRHREYIQDITASTAFRINSLPINPGLLGTFPYLSQIADSFEQFDMRGLVFEFKTMSSDAVLSSGASSALGTVIFATQYNALDKPFEDKRTMENYEFANSTKPSESMLHPVECKRSQTPVDLLYVRTEELVSTGDLRMYDLGNFSFAVQGCQNAAPGQVIGELWCSFEVEFFKPKLLPLGGASTLMDHYQLRGANLVGPTNPFYTQNGLTRLPGSNLGTYIQVSNTNPPHAANSILFPPTITDGIFKIDYYLSGTAATANSPGMSPNTPINCSTSSDKALFYGANSSSTAVVPQPTLTGVTVWHWSQIIDIQQITPGIQSSIGVTMSGAYPTGNQSLDLVITLLDADA